MASASDLFADYDQLAQTLKPLSDAFAGRDQRLYLVGGVVRDLAVGRRSPGDDVDLTTPAAPAAIRSLLEPLASSLWAQGERFGTVGATIGDESVEITTHRAEVYVEDSRKPEVSFGTDLVVDLSRRDFTINAMAIDLQTAELIDPYGGWDDLDARVLRTPLDPGISFRDDPLRMFRAARFVPRFDLAVDPALIAAMDALRNRITIVSRERIRDELERLLGLDSPAAGWDLLALTGLWSEVVPAWLAVPASEQDRAFDAASTPQGSPRARRAGLLLPLGPQGAAAVLNDLRYPKAEQAAVASLLEATEMLGSAPSPANVRSLCLHLGTGTAEGLGDLWTVATQWGAEVGPWRTAVADLAGAESLGVVDLPVTGTDIMNRYQLAPGRAVGALVERLRETWIERGPLTEAQAWEVLDASDGRHRG